MNDTMNYINKNDVTLTGFVAKVIKKEFQTVVILAMPNKITKKTGVVDNTNFPHIVFSGKENKAMVDELMKQDYVTIHAKIFSGSFTNDKKSVMRLSGISVEKKNPNRYSFDHTAQKDNLFNVAGKVTFIRPMNNNSFAVGLRIMENHLKTHCVVDCHPKDISIVNEISVGDNVAATGDIRTRIDKKDNQRKLFINLHSTNVTKL